MHSTKQKIIVYLLAVSFVLLLGNILVDRFHKVRPGTPQPGKSILAAGEINTIFEDAVGEFGIEKTWIKRKPAGTDEAGDAVFNYTVKISPDLPAALILNEFNRRFLDHGLTVSSKELRKEKTTSLKILEAKKVMLQADFVTDPSLLRQAATIGFIVKDVDKLNDNEFQDFLSLPENYAILLSPSDKSEKAGKDIVSQNKEYAVVLDDKIDEVPFRFDDDYSEKRLSTSIRTILGSFGNAKVFMIDDMSDLYRSRPYVTIKSSFEKRKLNLIPISRYTEIKSREDKDIASMFRYYCESTTSGERVFLVTARNFLQLKDMIDLYRKKGYKFVFPSQLNFGLSPSVEQEQSKPEQTQKGAAKLVQVKKQGESKKQIKKK